MKKLLFVILIASFTMMLGTSCAGTSHMKITPLRDQKKMVYKDKKFRSTRKVGCGIYTNPVYHYNASRKR